MRGRADKSLIDFKPWSPQALERAKEIQANLSPEHATFIKVMQRSHVESTFYMTLPASFCQKHVGELDESVVLEIENGQSYDVKLLGSNRAFSGGWRGLAIAEKLVENDILVFHLVESNKFKVYIVRASEFGPVEKTHEAVKIDDKNADEAVKIDENIADEAVKIDENIADEAVKIDECAKTEGVEKKRKRVSRRPRFLGDNIEACSSSKKKPKKSQKKKGSLDKSSNISTPFSAEAMETAKEIKAKLGSEHPSFIKLMVKSYLHQPFYLALPAQFCQKYLPQSDVIIVLEVKNGKTYDVKLLGEKRYFSGGWRRFFEAENVEENDILVFHLVEPCKFKVYIVRASEFAPVEKDQEIVKIDDSTPTKEVEKKKNHGSDKRRHRVLGHSSMKKKSEEVPVDKPPAVDDIDDNATITKIAERKSVTERGKKRLKLVASSDSSNVEDCLPLQSISDFEDFKVIVDGKTIELPEQVMREYFKLCSSQKIPLHRHLDSEVATLIITKAVTISNAIRDSKVSTPREDIESWLKMLVGCEAFGMDVGFIKARLNRLLAVKLELEEYREAKIERERIEKEIIELKNVKRRLDDKIKGVEEVGARFEVIYEEEACAPW